ncbi:MAG: alpha/beta hydrolase [Saprospiraceae bacterium]
MRKNLSMQLSFYLILFIPFPSFSQTQFSGSYSSFDKTKIHYEVWGEGLPIVLIHGFTGTCNDWKSKPLADSLLASGYKLILIDLRGNGLSDQPDVPEAYANNAEARDVKGLMHFLKIKKYDAVGYSRGSIILASLLVLEKHCKRAVLGGMGADFTNPIWSRRIGFYNALMNDTIKGYEGFRTYIAGKGLNPLVLACQQKEQPSTSKEELAKLKQKVLIICGNEDSDNGKGSDLQSLIPHSEFVEIKGNHNSSAYTPEFAEQILRFLKQ